MVSEIMNVFHYYNYYFLLQYYDDTYATVKEQKAFEKNLFNKTHRANGRLCAMTVIHPKYKCKILNLLSRKFNLVLSCKVIAEFI